ncbi:MAG: DUF2169 domain-containing protein [Solidesulfovibrio sp.]
MKIYKKNELAFAITPYGAAGGNYISLAAMAFFDLTAPEGLLTEQDLWKAVPDALGPGGVLDPGLPKMRGEVLVAGAACAPRGSQTQGLRPRIKVGSLDKSLAVFGDRFWLPDGAASEPRPFAAMPLVYDNAFGGPDVPANPTGKGTAPVALPDGRVAVPLPNIEGPGHLVVSKDDRPEPTGFGPLDITWPQRARYNGTYDARWKAERWPGFPDDTDFLLFNRAPADQWITDFFRGDETFAIENMHPDMPTVSGILPGLRARLFVTLLAGYKLFADPATFTETFVEVPMRLETIWLFPTILRGLVLYRGSIPNADDEARDVARIYAAWERQTEPAATIEEYAERQRKAMDRSVPIDMTPFAAAGKKMAKAVKMVKNAPKVLARIKEKVGGRTPVMPVGTADILASARETAAGNMATLDTLEGVAKDLHARFGHLAEIDLERFDGLRQTVKNAVAAAEETAGRLDKAAAKAAAVKAGLLAKSKAFMEKQPTAKGVAARGLNMGEFLKRGYDPNFRFPDTDATGIPFHDAGFPFAVACRRALQNDAPTRDALRRLGLPDAVTARAWLGINPETRQADARTWGLPDAPDGSPAGKFDLPAGLVFPRFDGPTLNRLLIRPGAAHGDCITPDGDVLIPGSAAEALALPPSEPGGCWVRVADELQALFMEEEIGDACGVAALPDPGAKPGPDAAKAMAAAEALAVVLPEGTNLSDKDWTDWKATHKNAVPVILPKGRTVFESRAAGCDIRALIMDALPADFAAKHAVEPTLPKPGQPPSASPYPPVRFPDLGIGQAVTDAMARTKAAFAPMEAKMTAMREEAEAGVAAEAAKHGTTMADLKAFAATEAKRSPAEYGAEPIAKLAEQKEQMRRNNMLTPKTEATIDETIARAKAVVDKAESQYQAGMARLAAAEETFADAKKQFAAGTIPGMSLEEMRQAGLDPDLARPMTRDEVIARHASGLSFARRNLTGLDLSGLDLAGIDLAGAILEKTVFIGTRLDGARLGKAVAPDADFTKASLREANLDMGLFMGAKLRKANLSGASLKQTVLGKADLTKADLSGASLHMALLTDAKLTKALFTGTRCRLTVIDGTDLTKTDFRGVVMDKTILRNLTMDRTDFSGATLHSVQLSGVTGRKVVFAGADMTKFRTGKDCVLPETNFQGAILKQAILRESDLSGADFRGACLDGAMIELCDAKGTNCNRISAKNCSIIKTDLAGADLFGINLFQGSLRKSRLTGANLGRSNLYGVDVFKCTIGGTNFDGANLKRTLLEAKTDLLS